MEDSAHLEQKRRELFRTLEDAHDGLRYAKVQELLRAEIVQTEEACDQYRSDKVLCRELKSHIHLCRIIGDAIAWSLFTPHTIRQLFKNEGHPPFLKNQREATDMALAAVHELAERTGIPSVVADLTHVLKIGDVLIPAHGDCPAIIEFKKSGDRGNAPSPANRAGRQMLRMQGTTEYLRNDRVRMFDETKERVALEIDAAPDHNWEHVGAACAQALESGTAFVPISNFEFLCCLRHDCSTEDLLATTVRLDLAHRMIGAHCRYLEEEVTPLVPPVLNWPIGVAEREALFTRDIDLIHIIDPTGIVGYENEGIRIAAFDASMEAYRLEGTDYNTYASLNWLTWWLYGYQDTESLCRMMTEFCKESIELWEMEFGANNTIDSYR